MAEYSIGGWVEYTEDAPIGSGVFNASDFVDIATILPGASGVISDGAPGSSTFDTGETLTAQGFIGGTPFGPSVSGPFEGTVGVLQNGVGVVQLPVISDGSGSYFVAFPDGTVPGDFTFPADQTFLDLTTAAFTPCFLADTRIATPEGARAVQDLQIGDLILTADGRAVAVRWLGVRRVSSLFGAADRGGGPVCIPAGALGDGLPLADLRLTADHALLVDGSLVNAGALVGLGGIHWIAAADLGAQYDVFHIETDAHDIILAHGVAVETFIDYTARAAFDNHAEYVALYGKDRTVAELDLARISTARMLPASLKARLTDLHAA